jgi:hypothetical protein
LLRDTDRGHRQIDTLDRHLRSPLPTADGLTETGTALTMTTFGRIISLPAAYAGGGKALSTSYFAIGMVATQTQGTINDTPPGGSCVTRAYEYDADSNRMSVCT